MIGAILDAGRASFRVWAPSAKEVALLLGERTHPMQPAASGYHVLSLDGLDPGTRYRFSLDGAPAVADPASRWQPEGVHGPSALVDHRAYAWADAGWHGRPLREAVIEEIHIGTFTAGGTFDAAIDELDDLVTLGITAIEVMPIAQFPGERNWGYDGVFPFAVQDTYGGPEGFKRFVDASHRRGLSVIVDVVYNHLGPEGAPHRPFGPYFTDRYRTPWGDAINVDGGGSDHVRAFFIENAVRWILDYHVDGLRVDAIHGIVDTSAQPFLGELVAAAHRAGEETGRTIWMIAESDLNDPRTITHPEAGGAGFDAQWNDDLHHAIHAFFTGDRSGYYADFGTIGAIAKALSDGFVYDGAYSAFRDRRHGAQSQHIDPSRFVGFAQNHDQIGNRLLGERLASLVDPSALRMVAGLVILGGSVPMLFMGEEYGETAPFGYFVSHSDPELIESVRRGRADEFAAFGWSEDPPDPQSPQTFLRSKLDRRKRRREENATLRDLYAELIALRGRYPGLGICRRNETSVTWDERQQWLRIDRSPEGQRATVAFALGGQEVSFDDVHGRIVLDTASTRWGGKRSPRPQDVDGHLTIAPRSFVVVAWESA